MGAVLHTLNVRLFDDDLHYIVDHALTGRVAKWWLPDRVEFISEVPKTSVGKFNKKMLRAQLADGTLGLG